MVQLLLALLVAVPQNADSPERPEARPLIQVEIARPARWLAALRERDVGLPPALADRAFAALEQGLEELEGALGPLEPLLDGLAGRRARLLAHAPARGAEDIVLWTEGREIQGVEQALESALSRWARLAATPSIAEPVHASLAGATWWQPAPGAWIARQAERVFLAGSESTLARLLRAHHPGGDASTRTETANLWVEVDLGTWRAVDPRGVPGQLHGARSTPEGLLVVGAGLLEWIGGDRMELRAQRLNDQWSLTASSVRPGERPADHGAFDSLLPKRPAVTRAFWSAPQNLARALLHRDVGALAQHRQALLGPAAASEMADKLRELEIFFGGLRLDEDVLGSMSPWWQVVVREIQLPDGSGPALLLPAAIAAVDIPDDPRLAHALESAFQNIVALANVEARQAGRNRTWLLRTQSFRGVSYSAARPPPLSSGERGDLTYNLQPAIAVTEGVLLLASHEALLLDVLDELERAPASPDGVAPQESLQVQGRGLAEWARSNAATLELLLSLYWPDGPSWDEWLVWLDSGDLHVELTHGESAVELSVSAGPKVRAR